MQPFLNSFDNLVWIELANFGYFWCFSSTDSVFWQHIVLPLEQFQCFRAASRQPLRIPLLQCKSTSKKLLIFSQLLKIPNNYSGLCFYKNIILGIR